MVREANNIRNTIERGLAMLGMDCSASQADGLLFHLREIERWNARFNLVRASGEELAIKHTLDSLSGLAVVLSLQAKSTLLDIGSGAGFPGIPLAIFMQDARLTLAERHGKRAAFLSNMAILLKLSNTRVFHGDYKDLLETFDVVTFRAFAPLQVEIGNIAPRLGERGVILAYKGKKSNAEAEAEELSSIGYYAEAIPLSVPFLDEERSIVLVRKL